jgi:hypothetical protein
MAGIAAGIGAAASVAGAGSSIAKGIGGGGSGKLTEAEFNDLGLRYAGEQLWDDPRFQAPSLSTTPYQGYTWLQDFVPQTYDPWIGQVYQMSDDTASLAAENQALAQEQQWAKGGLTPTDMQTLAQIEAQQAGANSSAIATAADQLRQRGLGGAGAEYAAMLQGNQNASNQAQQLYDSALQTALQRQLTATQNSGTLAGNIRQQSDTVSQQMAAINNAFNTEVQNLRTAAAQNAASVQNAAQAANLAGRQSVANENVGIANQNADLTRQIQQQNYNNQLQWLSGKTNAMNGVANYYGALDAAQGQQRQGASQSLTNGLNALTSLANNKTVQDGLNSIGNWFSGPSTQSVDTGQASQMMNSDLAYQPGVQQPIDIGSFDV